MTDLQDLKGRLERAEPSRFVVTKVSDGRAFYEGHGMWSISTAAFLSRLALLTAREQK